MSESEVARIYRRSDAAKLKSAEIRDILESRGTIPYAARTLAKRYKTSQTRIYSIWRSGGDSEAGRYKGKGKEPARSKKRQTVRGGGGGSAASDVLAHARRSGARADADTEEARHYLDSLG